MTEKGFINQNKSTTGGEAIFGIFSTVKGRFKLIGTGFFITEEGMYVTAKHVLEDEVGPIYAIHLPTPNKYHIRQLRQDAIATNGDIAVGMMFPQIDPTTGLPLRNKNLTLSSHVPAVGEAIATHAFPETTVAIEDGVLTIDIKPRFYRGVVSDTYPNGMGHIKTSAVIANNMESLGGCSGGPVFSMDSKGSVIGINSRGIEGQYNVVSLNEALFGIILYDVELVDQVYEEITIKQLIDLGFILKV